MTDLDRSGSLRRLRPSRRRVIQGGVATGVVLSAPLFPFRPAFSSNDTELVSEPIDLSAALFADGPELSAQSAGRASGGQPSLSPSLGGPSGSLVVPVAETDVFTGLGVSWDGASEEGAAVRVRSGGIWSDWQELHVDPSHGPDPFEAPLAPRRTSDRLFVGHADAYELAVPAGASGVVLHRLRDTGRPIVGLGESSAGAGPSIRPRSEWNADEPTNPPVFAPPSLAIVHHSAGGAQENTYTQAQTAGLIKSVQKYHQNGNGWNDIAYNFVVDRFGRTWEGRAGGVAQGVIGGHTYGCNTGTIGICYLGDLRYVEMPTAAKQAISDLISWKFNRVHNIHPTGTCLFAPVSYSASRSRYPAGVYEWHPTIVGHGHFGRTECPASANAVVVPGLLADNTTNTDFRGISSAVGGAWSGVWLVTAKGQAVPKGWMPFHGSMQGEPLAAPMINLAPTPTGDGYWMLGADGGIFTFGDARFYGSMGGQHLNAPVVGMAATKSGKGYWLVASDGGIFAFGDASFHGSMGGRPLNAPVIGMMRTPSGDGYWMFASDGGIFAFGDAGFFGSAGGSALPSAAVGVGAHPSGAGYWLALANGTVRAYGNAVHHGNASASWSDPVIGISATLDGGGYWLATRSGKVITFGNAT